MARTRNCTACGQPMRYERLGVHMTPLKAEIFDAIKAAGDDGVPSIELRHNFPSKTKPAALSTIKAHVWQLNNLYLPGTDWLIVSEGRGANHRWYLRRRPRERAA